ncbi:MAG: DUF4349 domain-containing protein [Eubacteriales bacterium]|nr:DUF4349 domain-containing protein [Eubacteriales bacterium]
MKRNHFVLGFLLLLSVSLLSCSNKSGSVFFAENETAYPMVEYAMDEAGNTYFRDGALPQQKLFSSKATGANDISEEVSSANTNNSTEKKLIKRVYIDAESNKYDNSIESIENSISKVNAYIENKRISGNNEKDTQNRRSAYYVIRVPKDNVEKFLSSIDGDINILSKEESVEDVSLQYSDTMLRKESLYLEREKLNELLKKATKIEDILKINERLSSVNYEIVRIERTIRNYDNDINYSTITINLYEVKIISSKQKLGVGERIRYGFFKNIEDIKNNIVESYIYVISHLPIITITIIILGIIILIVILCYQKRTKRKKKTKDNNKDIKEL